MFKNNWYSNLAPLKQLGISFVLNWFYWLVAGFISREYFFDRHRPWEYYIFHATWMAFFMTITFNWKKIKGLFRRKNETIS